MGTFHIGWQWWSQATCTETQPQTIPPCRCNAGHVSQLPGSRAVTLGTAMTWVLCDSAKDKINYPINLVTAISCILVNLLIWSTKSEKEQALKSRNHKLADKRDHQGTRGGWMWWMKPLCKTGSKNEVSAEFETRKELFLKSNWIQNPWDTFLLWR